MSSRPPGNSRGPIRGAGRSPILGVRFSPEVLAALDRFVAGSDAFATRSEVIRAIVTAWLAKNQMLEESAGPQTGAP